MVIANRFCKHDNSHKETETVLTEYRIQSPTANKKGLATYTAAFESESFCRQKKTIEIPALRNMRTLKMPNSLKTIESEAFMGANCEAIIIDDECKAIEEMAFANCANLIYVWVPKSVIRVDIDAFKGCEDVVIDYEQ